MLKKSVLLVHEGSSVRCALSKLLRLSKYEVTAVSTYNEAVDVFRNKKYNLIVSSSSLSDGNGLELIQKLQKENSNLRAIVTINSVEVSEEIKESGISHYTINLLKKGEFTGLVKSILKGCEKLSSTGQNGKKNSPQINKNYLNGFVSKSDTMMQIFDLINKVADSDSTVLISGESGTGKDLVARALHYHSSRFNKAFIPVNCAAIPRNLLESELFGYVKGAFTGAISDRIGRFQAADKGTLFLDEIGDMPPELQVKLLRFLQNKEFEPVGSISSMSSDTRIIAATNIDLDQAVASKLFREDLYYRLNVIPICVPPLRERKNDIPLLVEEFLKQFNKERKYDVSINSTESMNILKQYSWPGNIRELENLIQRLVILKQSGDIEPKDFPKKMFLDKFKISNSQKSFIDFELPEEGVNFKELVNSFEDHLLQQALSRTDGNKNKASELLRLNRTTLVEKVKRRQISK